MPRKTTIAVRKGWRPYRLPNPNPKPLHQSAAAAESPVDKRPLICVIPTSVLVITPVVVRMLVYLVEATTAAVAAVAVAVEEVVAMEVEAEAAVEVGEAMAAEEEAMVAEDKPTTLDIREILKATINQLLFSFKQPFNTATSTPSLRALIMVSLE
ncbi:hypothetical protein H4R24_001510 [Coemansia sp. RSA 988]|nr:hypothetical protein H4R24_001510 [Coemansia sp. RSA 988]